MRIGGGGVKYDDDLTEPSKQDRLYTVIQTAIVSAQINCAKGCQANVGRCEEHRYSFGPDLFAGREKAGLFSRWAVCIAWCPYVIDSLLSTVKHAVVSMEQGFVHQQAKFRGKVEEEKSRVLNGRGDVGGHGCSC